METIDEFLAHFGVKGMKWGVRRRLGHAPSSTVQLKTNRKGAVEKVKGGKNKASSEDAIKALVSKQVAKESGTHALTNADLQHLVKRMQLEKQFAELGGTSASKSGKKFVANLLGTVGNQQAQRVAGVAATVAVNAAIAKQAAKSTSHPLVKEVSKKLGG